MSFAHTDADFLFWMITFFRIVFAILSKYEFHGHYQGGGTAERNTSINRVGRRTGSEQLTGAWAESEKITCPGKESSERDPETSLVEKEQIISEHIRKLQPAHLQVKGNRIREEKDLITRNSVPRSPICLSPLPEKVMKENQPRR